MRNRLSGIETEYACTMLGATSEWPDPGELLIDAAKRDLPYLPSSEGGIFTANGGRLYIDSGRHPEFSSPEVASPWDTCRYIKAGDNIILNATEAMMKENRNLKVVINRGSVCYAEESGSSWACHESICHQISDREKLRKQLVPHLVSRQIFSGAGGFDNLVAGLEFMISPRVAHLTCKVGDNSQSERPIYHTKEEPFCEGFHRLHIICGETVCSELSQWLKTATTVLVVSLIEMDASPQGLLTGISELSAMRRIAKDQSLKKRSSQRRRKSPTAVQIQRSYLAKVEENADDPRMPSWTAEACEKWRDVLDRLEFGSLDDVATRLDWAIKLKLYRQFCENEGIQWDDLDKWNGAAEMVAGLGGSDVLTDTDRRRIDAYLARWRLSWPDFQKFLATRQKLFELDTRFGLLGGGGLFDSLVEQGVLDQHVEGVDRIADAVSNPPEGATRARARSEAILQLQLERDSCHCQWNEVRSSTQYYCLANPYSQKVIAKPLAADSTLGDPTSGASLSRHQRIANATLASAERRARAGLFLSARELLSRRRERTRNADAETRLRLLQLQTSLNVRLGDIQSEDLLEDATPTDLESICRWLAYCRFNRIVPNMSRVPELLSAGSRILSTRDHEWRGAFLEQTAAFALADGRSEEVLAILSVVNPESPRFLGPWARSLATLGEAHRRLGNLDQSRRLLLQAEEVQRGNELLADFTWMTLPSLARLTSDDQERREYLAEGLQLCGDQNPIGEIRIRLLLTRLVSMERSERDVHRDQIEQLRDATASVTACPLIRSVLTNWQGWCGGANMGAEKWL